MGIDAFSAYSLKYIDEIGMFSHSCLLQQTMAEQVRYEAPMNIYIYTKDGAQYGYVITRDNIHSGCVSGYSAGTGRSKPASTITKVDGTLLKDMTREFIHFQDGDYLSVDFDSSMNMGKFNDALEKVLPVGVKINYRSMIG